MLYYLFTSLDSSNEMATLSPSVQTSFILFTDIFSCSLIIFSFFIFLVQISLTHLIIYNKKKYNGYGRLSVLRIISQPIKDQKVCMSQIILQGISFSLQNYLQHNHILYCKTFQMNHFRKQVIFWNTSNRERRYSAGSVPMYPRKSYMLPVHFQSG